MFRHRVQKTPVQSGIERHPQFAVIIVAKSNKAERLQARALKLARGIQHFGHAMDGAGSGVERDLDEIAGGKLMLQLQQSAGDGKGLKFCARPLAAFGHYRGRN